MSVGPNVPGPRLNHSPRALRRMEGNEIREGPNVICLNNLPCEKQDIETSSTYLHLKVLTRRKCLRYRA